VTTPRQPFQHGPAAPRHGRVPAPLAVAALLVAVEALVLVVLGLAELRSLSTSRLVMGATTSLFFAAGGAGLGWCGWQLYRLRSWARAPVVLAQLIQILVAWGFRGGSTSVVAGVLIVVAVAVLVGVFHPASIRAIEGDADGRVD
jgi:hypothetical protein